MNLSQAELRRMAEALSTRELAASAAVAEAEALREQEVEEARGMAAQLRDKIATMERVHAAQVRKLCRQPCTLWPIHHVASATVGSRHVLVQPPHALCVMCNASLARLMFVWSSTD
jgi:hypothetical protein